ncbi:MAG: ACP S-malonyltransferase [Streptosporangiaceae bacterium]|jgi:[acyl-carrier-protein] S-malonyltransferase
MTALLFPGQGSQRVGMGQALRMAFPAAVGPVLDQAWALDAELATLMRRGPLPRLARTEHSQLAVTATNLSALAVVLRSRPEPAGAVAGHSVGFLSALVAAGSLGVGAALRLARLRGELMGSLPLGGTMASISGLTLAETQDLTARAARETGAIVVIGLVNGPLAIVASGDEPAVGRVCALASDRGARATRLSVSHAFHSPFMQSVRDPWSGIVRGQEFGTPSVPLVADLTGEIIESPERIREVLVEQLTCTVRWDLVSARLIAADQAEAIEVGDSTVLRGFARSYPGLHVSSMAQPQTLALFRPARERPKVPAASVPGPIKEEAMNG